MQVIKYNAIPITKEIKNITIVLIIDKKEGYPSDDGEFDISQIKFLALKNAINNWQKMQDCCVSIQRL